MGLTMSAFYQDAVAWSGTDATLSMFVISSEPVTAEFAASLAAQPPHHINIYDLEDEAGVLGERHIREFDLVWGELPDHLEQIVSACLQGVMSAGSEVAWFGFEGSFDYDHLLHPDIADQIYAIGASGELWIAMEDEKRRSKEWRSLLAVLRRRVIDRES